MNEINNQNQYWDRVAEIKTFTHPLDLELLKEYFVPEDRMLDYGCGYGRITETLYQQGFQHIIGVDTSAALIKRGLKNYPHLNLVTIPDAASIPVDAESINLVLLFAVITCIPSNAGQQQLIKIVRSKLQTGGIIYISDYYLQQSREEVKAYENYENDPSNYGVFTLPEGATFRHHTREWILELLKDFEIISEKIVEVKTMNGHVAEAFQILARKK